MKRLVLATAFAALSVTAVIAQSDPLAARKAIMKENGNQSRIAREMIEGKQPEGDADAIEAALLAHRDEFRLCYEREINAEHPALAGRVGTTFVIGSSGRVTEAGIESTTLKNANVERCVVQVIKRIDFPMPRGGGVVQVTYPFKYSPAGTKGANQ